MEVRQRLFDVDDLWALYCERGGDERRYELIDGEIIEMPGPGGAHGRVAARFTRFLDQFADEHGLGLVTVETGYYAADSRFTVLFPDVAYISNQRAPDPFPDNWIPCMPESAVEIMSPSNSLGELREKARIYLRHGAELVWIAQPAEQSVEVWRRQSDGGLASQTLRLGDCLSGEGVLPGFALELDSLFTAAKPRPV